MPHFSTCPVCQQSKPHNRHLCTDCHGTYGQRSDWPAWLQMIVNDIEREQCDDQLAARYEMPLDDFETDEDSDDDFDGPLWTRPRSELSGSDSGCGLPYAPYPDEETNRQYRRSNGIPARNTPKSGLSTVTYYDTHRPNLPEGWWEAGRLVVSSPITGG